MGGFEHMTTANRYFDIAVVDKSTTVEVLTVTPLIARQMLSRNVEGNRTINASRVDQYARSMRSGAWIMTGESVKFDDAGRLIDGQHRLAAVIASDTPVKMMVMRGISGEAFHVIDHGFTRPKLWWMTTYERATVQALARYRGGKHVRGGSSSLTQDELISFYERYADAIEFTTTRIPPMRGMDAVARCVFARAFYHVDHDLLAEFASCVTLKTINESSIRQFIAHRTHEILTETTRSFGAAACKKYLKLERAIVAFVDCEPLKKIYEAKGELFPIPDDDLIGA